MYNGFEILDSMRNSFTYDGTTLKFGATVDNKRYIIKFKKGTVSSLYSEYVASRFIQNIGVKCHNVWLGYYNGELVNIIEDFVGKGEQLKSYKSTGQYYEDTDVSTKKYTYSDVLDMIKKHRKLSQFNKQWMLTQFWDMFICDAILGNRDRHWGNWGYITDGKSYRPAPLYDNGACLFPDVEKCISEFGKNKFKFISERSERFPASLFMVDDPLTGKTKRTNYYEILGDLRINKTLAFEVKNLRTKKGFSQIYESIIRVVMDSKDFIPYEYRAFYLYIVCVRYLHMIERVPIKKAFSLTEKRVNQDARAW